MKKGDPLKCRLPSDNFCIESCYDRIVGSRKADFRMKQHREDAKEARYDQNDESDGHRKTVGQAGYNGFDDYSRSDLSEL